MKSHWFKHENGWINLDSASEVYISRVDLSTLIVIWPQVQEDNGDQISTPIKGDDAKRLRAILDAASEESEAAR